MIIKITPLDTLFFRTGKPFTAGEDTYAEVVFPPYPSTLYGAIRSFVIAKRGPSGFYSKKYSDDLGTTETKGSFTMKGPFVTRDGIPCFPAPLDTIKIKDKLKALELSEYGLTFVSNHTTSHILSYRGSEKVESPEGLFLDINPFKEYLKREKEEFGPIEREEIYKIEQKISIKRERRVTKEEFLCRIPLIRMENGTSLVCEVDGISGLGNEGILRLGGEGKGARFEVIDDLLKDIKELELSFSNKLFKLYLATPAMFEKGWLPSWINEESLEGEFNGIRLKLITATIGKPVLIGGWDIAKGKSKPMRKAVPAGGVYYFEILDKAEPERIKECFHLKSISDINPEEGFGISILGEVRI